MLSCCWAPVVYQCLTGRAPFHATSPQELRTFYERSDQLRPQIPSGTSPQLAELICSLLRKNPKERLQAADFFKHPFMRDGKNRKVFFRIFLRKFGNTKVDYETKTCFRNYRATRPQFPRSKVAHLARLIPDQAVKLVLITKNRWSRQVMRKVLCSFPPRDPAPKP